MGFDFDQEKRAAVDRQRGISVHVTDRGDDTYPLMTFRYESPHLSFKFAAVIRSERRTYFWKGVAHERNLPVEIDVLEPSVKAGLREGAGAPTSPEECEQLKNILKEAMTAYGIPRYLDNSPIFPEFEVKFVEKVPAA
jgi:hypothetical protein